MFIKPLATALLICSTMPAWAQLSNWTATTTYTVQFDRLQATKWGPPVPTTTLSNLVLEHDSEATEAFIDGLYTVLASCQHPTFAVSPLGTIDYDSLHTEASCLDMMRDTVVEWIENPDSGEMEEVVTVYEVDRGHCIGFTVEQDLHYRPKDQRFSTQTYVLAPLFGIHDHENGGYRGFREHGYLSTAKKATPATTLAEVAPKAPLTQPEVAWAERIQFVFAPDDDSGVLSIDNPPATKPLKRLFDQSLAQLAFQQGQSRSAIAWANAECTQRLTPQELEAAMQTLPEANRRQRPLNEHDIHYVRLRQQWSFDAKNFTLSSTITAMAPMRSSMDVEGNAKVHEPLFWIKTE